MLDRVLLLTNGPTGNVLTIYRITKIKKKFFTRSSVIFQTFGTYLRKILSQKPIFRQVEN